VGKRLDERRAHARPHVELDRIALAIVEADRFDAIETVERPGEAGRRILAAGEQRQRARFVHRSIPSRENLMLGSRA
jgi:hypothetical protein